MTAPSFTYSGNVYTGAAAGTVDFALTSTTGNAIAYLEPSHIHVYKSSNQGVTWTELTRPSQWNFVTNGTVARLATGIAAGDWVKVQRITPSTSSYVTFQASSLLTAEQLNDDTLFNTYLNQERVDQGDQSTVTANSAVATAASAVTTANSAVTTANSAVTTANNAVATANSASATAASAVTTANSAVSTANSAVTTAGNAVSTANAATATAGNAVTTANSAVSTANAATATANSAVSTANTASSNASAALNAVAGSLQYVLVANVAAIPASPPNNYAIEVADSTGVESFSPLANRPAGFVGDVGLSVRMQYSTTGPTWNWLNYFSNNPETRYLKLSGGTLTGQLRADDSTSVAAPVIAFDGDTNTGIAHTGADELALVTGGTARLTIDPSGNVAVSGGLTKGGNSVVTTGDTGSVTSTMIADGAIVNADVNASAAIAGTKINPDFGSQSITTTGTATAASLIPSSSTVPTNGVYLPSANTVGISTNGTGRLFVDASGNLLVGTSSSGSQSGTFGQSLRGNNPGLTFIGTEASGAIRTIYESAGNLIFWNGTGGTEIARFDSSGRLGIGTSSPADTHSFGGVLDLSGSQGGALYVRNQTSASKYGAFGFYDTDIYVTTYATGNIRFNTGSSGAERMRITSAGNVGIGTTSPSATLDVVGSIRSQNLATGGGILDAVYSGTSTGNQLGAVRFYGTGAGVTGESAIRSSLDSGVLTASNLTFSVSSGGSLSEAVRIDSSRRLLVGTSSGSLSYSSVVVRGNPAASGVQGTLELSRASLPSTNGSGIGTIAFTDSSSNLGATIAAIAEGSWTSGSNHRSRLEFSVTSDGSASPVERARVTSSGFFKASNTGSYQGATGTYHEFRTDLDDQCLYLQGTNASWNNHLILGRATQAANSSYKFALFQSGNGGDTEFNLRGDGNAYADGSWNGGGADYAEYFEWSDNNPEAQDRRGISVVLDGDKIREAVAGEDPIGVISGNPSVVGDSAWNKWSGKYLRDEFGTYIQEDYEVTDDDGNTVIQQRRKLNPAYNPDVEYISREQRPEWDCVGLMGKLRIRKGQVTGSRWIKMRDISDSVEEWLVR